MTKPIVLLGISGSLRRASYNTGMLRALIPLLPDNVALEIFTLHDLPTYNADVEKTGFPPSVQVFKTRIQAADALILATPEYNYSIPGVLKNAVDWASRPPKGNPFNDKPTAIIGASSGAWGTSRAQYELRKVCIGLNMLLMNRPEVLVANAGQKFDADGNLTEQDLRDRLKLMLDAFIGWIGRVKGV